MSQVFQAASLTLSQCKWTALFIAVNAQPRVERGRCLGGASSGEPRAQDTVVSPAVKHGDPESVLGQQVAVAAGESLDHFDLTNVITRYYIRRMKRRFLQPDAPPTDPLDALCDALLSVHERAGVRALLRDLCTPAELEALSDRWRVVPLLLEGLPYREIHERTAISVTTIGRVARCLGQGEGGYRLAAEQLGLPGIDALHTAPH